MVGMPDTKVQSHGGGFALKRLQLGKRNGKLDHILTSRC
jgi:hypothetical protein